MNVVAPPWPLGWRAAAVLLALGLACDGGAGVGSDTAPPGDSGPTGAAIGWREHRIDDEGLSGVPLRGSDGLIVVDLDGDGREDIVSVHESDDVYDGAAEGHVRVAFGGDDADSWTAITLAEGAEAGAAEDVAAGDLDGDGDPDLVVACELAHLLYLENPGGAAARIPERWERLVPAVTRGRGSFIRVFTADFDGDGRTEIVTPNKGAQNPEEARLERKEISIFRLHGDPLEDASWREHVLARVPWPINAQPVDLDGDGDVDVVAGSVAERRIFWLENESAVGELRFVERAIGLTLAEPREAGPIGGEPPELATNGFHLDFADLDGDGRLDLVTFDARPVLGRELLWLEQPDDAAGRAPGDGTARPWTAHRIGGYGPDSLVGIRLADIDGDGDLDVFTGGYSRGSRLADGEAAADQPLGRLAWFENPGDPRTAWRRHEISRRERGMFDQFVARDLDGDGDLDLLGTRGNSGPYDGVFWLEQVRREAASAPAFVPARAAESPEVPLPSSS